MLDSASDSTAKSLVFQTVRRLAAYVLPLGIGVGDFLQIAKSAFVTAAADQIRARGARVSTSQLSVVTGLPRADVATIRATGGGKSSRDGSQRTARVMDGWFSHPSYVDKDGAPKPLFASGRASFRELVKRFAGDVTPNAVLRELVANGMARIDERGAIVPLRRYIQVERGRAADVERLARDLEVAISCCLPSSQEQAGTLRRMSVTFQGSLGPAVRRNVAIRVQRFLDALSEYLHAASRSAASTPESPVAADVFHLIIAQTVEAERVDTNTEL
jgi:hypothetical protein